MLAIDPHGDQSQNTVVELNKEGNIPIYNLANFLERHDLRKRTFSLVKIDCECCEYEWIPSLADWILSKEYVEKISGELHPCRHERRGLSFEQLEISTLAILTARGCHFPVTSLEGSGRLKAGHTPNLDTWCH